MLKIYLKLKKKFLNNKNWVLNAVSVWVDNLLLLGWKSSFLTLNTVEGRKEKEQYNARLKSSTMLDSKAGGWGWHRGARHVGSVREVRSSAVAEWRKGGRASSVLQHRRIGMPKVEYCKVVFLNVFSTKKRGL